MSTEDSILRRLPGRLLRRVRRTPDCGCRRADTAGQVDRPSPRRARRRRRPVPLFPHAEGDFGDGRAAAGRATGPPSRALPARGPRRRMRADHSRQRCAHRGYQAPRAHHQCPPGRIAASSNRGCAREGRESGRRPPRPPGGDLQPRRRDQKREGGGPARSCPHASCWPRASASISYASGSERSARSSKPRRTCFPTPRLVFSSR